VIGPAPFFSLPAGGKQRSQRGPVLAIVIVLRHFASTYQQFMIGTGVGNVARLFVQLLHSDGHIPSESFAVRKFRDGDRALAWTSN
jgi:hypothetical protein